MSASCHWSPWLSARGRPNWRRAVRCSTTSSSRCSAAPTEYADQITRPAFRQRMAVLNPRSRGADDIGGGHAAVRQDDLRVERSAPARHPVDRADLEPWRSPLDDERRDPPRAPLGLGRREHREEVRDGRVGDVALSPVEHVVLAARGRPWSGGRRRRSPPPPRSGRRRRPCGRWPAREATAAAARRCRRARCLWTRGAR